MNHRTFVAGITIWYLSVLSLPPSMYSQTAVATLVGTVTDATGAALVGAVVAATNRETHERRQTVTTVAGEYRIPQLLPGLYDVAAEAKGFQRTSVTNFELQVQQTARVDMVMKIGEVTQTIEVSGQAAVLQTEEASVGNVVDSKRVVDLPLNGRGFLQLAFLVPGVAQTAGNSRTSSERGTHNGDSSISVGGNRENANVFLLDGTINTDRNYNMFALGPSVDAIREFKVEVNNYAPEFGGQGGGQINVITKSGSNAFHGTGWGFFRNSALDAKNLFDLPTQPIPAFDQKQFGFTAGGRIVRDKLFWFTNYEGFRQTKALTSLTASPTPDVRGGDFSNFRNAAGAVVPIYDPLTTTADPTAKTGYTRTPFPGNRIPANRIDPVATGLLKYIDPPNQSTVLPKGIGYFFNNFPHLETDDAMNHRVDYIPSISDRFFGRYSYSNEDATIPGSFTGQGTLREPKVQNATVSESHVFSPTLFNEFRVGFMRFRNYKFNINSRTNNVVGAVGIKNAEAITSDPDRWGVPSISLVDAGVSWGDTTISNARDNAFHYVDTITWIRGRHSFKFGADLLRDQLNNKTLPGSNGYLGIDGRYTNLPDTPGVTGSSIAQYLLGYADNQLIPRGNGQIYMRRWTFAFHANDDVKVTPNLTLNIGLRWEYVQPWVEKYDHYSMAAFFQPWGGPPPAFLKANDYPFAFSGSGAPIKIDPITGMPCTQCQKVSRGIILPNKRNFMPRFGFAWRPFGSQKWVIRGGGGVFFDTQIGNTIVDYARNPPQASGNYLQDPNFYFPTQRLDTFTPLPPGAVADGGWGTTVNFPRAHIINYNFTIQRQLKPSTSITMQYIGSQSRKLSISVGANNHIANVDACRLYPDVCKANNGIVPQDQRVIFQNGGGDDRTQSVFYCCQLAMPIVNAGYNAAAVTLERRFSNGLSVLSSYTFSKSIDDGGEIRGAGSADSEPNSWFRIGKDWRGLSNFDQKNRFVTSWLWELPFGKGKKLFAGASKGANYLVGGWSMNAIYTLASGNPFTVYDFSGDFSFVPNVTGNPKISRGQRGADGWFNPNVYQKVDPNGDIGNAGRNNLRAPGMNNWDFGINKQMPISEKLGYFEIRGEFFNSFNHPFLGFPNYTFGSGTFGKITSAHDPRNIQLAVKWIW